MKKLHQTIANQIRNRIFVVRESLKIKKNATNNTKKTNQTIQGEHNGESPSVFSELRFDDSRSDSPTLFNIKFNFMRESKDKNDSTLAIEEKEFEELQCFKKKSEQLENKLLLLKSFIIDKGLCEELQHYVQENDIHNFDEFISSVNTSGENLKKG